MYTKYYDSERNYTLKEARRIIECEQAWKRKQRKKRICNIIFGLYFIFVSILIPVLDNGDCTFSLFSLLCAWICFTKKEDENEE